MIVNQLIIKLEDTIVMEITIEECSENLSKNISRRDSVKEGHGR